MKKFALIVIGLVSILCLVKFQGTKEDSSSEEVEQHPGWYDYQIKRKGLDNPNLPKNLMASWYKTDMQNKVATKKSTQSLENIQELGPTNVGGRIRAVHVDHSNSNKYVVGGISGGIWVSTNAGQTWAASNDTAATLSVTSITQDPNNANVYYYGTGEAAGNSSDLGALGVFKSTDGASSFELLPASLTVNLGAIWDVKHSKVLPNTIYVATASTGLWRSNDGGATFTRIYVSGADIFEIECLEDSTILIGRENLGIVKINENNLQATTLNNGFPAVSGWRRITFDVCEKQPNFIYAHLTDAAREDLAYSMRSTDGGASWTQTNLPSGGRYSFAWYCFDLTVAPNDPSFVMSNSVESVYSRTSGATWFESAQSHADYHAAYWIDDNTVLIGNDGGLYRYSVNSMGNYVDLNQGLNITQFYAGFYPPETGTGVIGGTQDNGTRLSLGSSSFAHYFGGDGATCFIGQGPTSLRYFSYQNFNAYRQEGFSSEVKISDGLKAVAGSNAWDFIHPFEMNPRDEYQLYVPTESIGKFYRSTNGGDNWSELTTDRLIGDQISVGISNDDDPTIYVGGTGSRIYRKDNAATSAAGNFVDLWSATNTDFLGGRINCIEVDPQDKGTIYIAMNNIVARPRIWRATDADKGTPVYEDISSNLPSALAVNWVEVDPLDNNNIFIGTDYGLYSSLNAGASWQKEYRIPNVPIDQVRLRNSDRKLYIITHGRGIWSADLIDSPVASTESLNAADLVSLYPNPSTDYFQVSGMEVNSISVYNVKGQEVLQSKNTKVSIAGLPAGIYFVEAKNEKETVVKKLRVK